MAISTVDQKLAPEAIQAANAGIRSIWGNPSFPFMNRMPYTELQSWCTQVNDAMTLWTAGQEYVPVMHAFTELGREGQRHGVPGRELVHALAAVINACNSVQPRNGIGDEPSPTYRALRPLDTFFDFAKYYLIRGYEESSR